MAKIFLSVPILDKPEYKMVHSMYQSILSCKEHQVRLFVNENDSLIPRVRNVHMSLFLNEFKECDYFMSLDSDLEIVNCYHTNNLFTKLISHNVDFVGGLYALKSKEGKSRTSSVPLDSNIERTNMPFDQGLLPMRWLSSGCWCIKRSAVEKMAKSYPQLDYIGDDNVTGQTVHGLYNPDIFEIEDPDSKATFKKYLSEDWAWCERWMKIGGEIFADTSIVLKHIGKFPYVLWNVEVNKVSTQPAPKIAPEILELSKLEKPNVKEALPNVRLPIPGFDLNNFK